MYDKFLKFVESQDPDRLADYKSNCGCPLARFLTEVEGHPRANVGGFVWIDRNHIDQPIPRFLTHRMVDAQDDDNSMLNAETYGQLAERLRSIKPWDPEATYAWNDLVLRKGKVWRARCRHLPTNAFNPNSWEDVS